MNQNLESLQRQAKIISLESSTAGQLLEALPARLPGFVADVKSFISNFIGADPILINQFKIDRNLENGLKKINYTSIMDLTGHVPMGMTCSYSQYLSELEKGMDIIEELLPEVLTPSLRWIASLLSDPEKLSSISRNKEFKSIKVIDLNPIKKSMRKCMDDKGISDRAPLGDLIANIKEWSIVVTRLKKLQERYSAISRSKLIDTVTEITGGLETLYSRVEDEPDVYSISGKTMGEIADAATYLAEQVEYFSVFSFQLQQFSQAVEDTQTALANVLK